MSVRENGLAPHHWPLTITLQAVWLEEITKYYGETITIQGQRHGKRTRPQEEGNFTDERNQQSLQSWLTPGSSRRTITPSQSDASGNQGSLS